MSEKAFARNSLRMGFHNISIYVFALAILICAFAGCNSKDNEYYRNTWTAYNVNNRAHMHIIVHTWEDMRVWGYPPDDTEARECNKSSVERILKNVNSDYMPQVDILLTKNFGLGEGDYEQELGNLQKWLISQGVRHITFTMAMSKKVPSIFLEYHDGIITRRPSEE